MIFDKIENMSLYSNLPCIGDIKKFISENDMVALGVGDIEIKGEDLFVKILDYQTKSDDEFFLKHTIIT